MTATIGNTCRNNTSSNTSQYLAPESFWPSSWWWIQMYKNDTMKYRQKRQNIYFTSLISSSSSSSSMETPKSCQLRMVRIRQMPMKTVMERFKVYLKLTRQFMPTNSHIVDQYLREQCPSRVKVLFHSGLLSLRIQEWLEQIMLGIITTLRLLVIRARRTIMFQWALTEWIWPWNRPYPEKF